MNIDDLNPINNQNNTNNSESITATNVIPQEINEQKVETVTTNTVSQEAVKVDDLNQNTNLVNEENNFEKSTVVNFTPLEKVVEKPQVIIPPREASNSGAVKTETPNDLPPMPAQVEVAPSATEGVTVIDTVKKRTSNVILIFLIIGLVVFVMYLDPIIEFVEKNIIATNPQDSGEIINDNSLNGYIQLGDRTSYIQLKDIKFNNFVTSGDGKIILNYTALKDYKDASTLDIYIELYDNEKELLKRFLFDVKETEFNVTRTFILEVDNEIFSFAKYASVKIYSDTEKNQESSMICKIEKNESTFSQKYSVKYNFINYELSSYEIDKTLNVMSESDALKSLRKELKQENDIATQFQIQTNYEVNSLKYTVDLSNINESFIPLYKLNTTKAIIKNKENTKEWVCE